MMISAPHSGALAAGPDVTHSKLQNGLEVVVIADHRAPVVTHMVWYRVGAADEPRGKSGIAHFLEHLMFKGTDKVPPGEFSKIIARHGGQDNAFTTQDATAYFQRVAKDRLPLVMEMEADRMANLRLAESDVATERMVIIEERKSRIDNDPSSILQEQMQAALYLSHPYGIPIIGWEHEMRGLTRGDALAFYQRYYAPDNAVLVVAGDVEPDAVVALAERTYGKVAPSGGLPPRRRNQEPPPAAARRVILQDGRVGRATLSRYYLTPGYATAEPREAEALELLARIAGANGTGRLYKRLAVEEKKAVSAGGWYSGSGLDSGMLGFYAVAAGNVALETVEASLDAVLADIKENGVTEGELERVRNAAIADIIYSADSQSHLARTYGWALATGRTVADVKSREERLAAVTLEDIRAVAGKFLDPKRSVTGLLLPDPQQVAGAPRPVAPPQPGATIH